MTKIVFRRR